MKYASIKVLVLLLGSGGSIAACASGTDSLDFSTGADSASAASTSGNGGGGGGNGGSTAGNGGSTGVVNPSSTATTGGSQMDGGACIAKCYADYDCQNSCPVTETGINCCDTATNLCYVDSNSVCPMPQNDGGVVTPPY